MKFLQRIVSGFIDKRVDERINEIVKSEDIFQFRDISDKQAEKEIKEFILDKKAEDITELSTFDFVLKLKIPAIQIEKILDKFKKQNKIKEIYV